MTYVGAEVWTMVELARFAEKGAWPIGGGTLDQTLSFLQFMSRWQGTIDRLKAEEQS